MNQYQKVYMNQIHSSSLLGQLAQMWRSQMLCDALIRTGNITTKAHRVVLVAACPMLQSMDNASVGSHLEVRLAADIKQEAVNSFLQYLYEGFMMLTEENCKDVEKVARLLQVDSVTKCCIDFYNCLQKKTGVNVYTNTQYKYSSADLLEFRHVRTTDLQKTIQERMMKRASSDSVRPASPGGKRQRTQQQRPLSPNIDLAMFGQKADDTLSMTNSYMGNIGNQAADPWERVPRIGAAHRPPQKPGVIEIVEDSLEILQTQPPDKDASKSAPPVVQKSLAISVSSQLGSSTDVHVVNVNDQSSRPTAASDGPIMSTGRDSITVSPLTVLPGSSISSSFSKDTNRHPSDNQKESPFIKKSQLEQQSSTPQRAPFPVSISPARMSPISQISQAKKSFAAGSATQAATMSQSQDSSSMSKRLSSVGNEMADRPPSSESGKEMGAKSKTDDGSANSADMAPDLSIIKVEPNIDDPGLDMYVDVPDDSMIQTHRRDQREHDDESDVELEEASGDWSQNEMSNEAAGSDQNNSWYIGQFKGQRPQNDTCLLTNIFEKHNRKDDLNEDIFMENSEDNQQTESNSINISAASNSYLEALKENYNSGIGNSDVESPDEKSGLVLENQAVEDCLTLHPIYNLHPKEEQTDETQSIGNTLQTEQSEVNGHAPLQKEKIPEADPNLSTCAVPKDIGTINLASEVTSEANTLEAVEKTVKGCSNGDGKPKRKSYKSKWRLRGNRRVLSSLRKTSARLMRDTSTVSKRKALVSSKMKEKIRNIPTTTRDERHAEKEDHNTKPVIVTSHLAKRAASVVGKKAINFVPSPTTSNSDPHIQTPPKAKSHVFSKKGSSIVGKLIPSKPSNNISEPLEQEHPIGLPLTNPIVLIEKVNVGEMLKHDQSKQCVQASTSSTNDKTESKEPDKNETSAQYRSKTKKSRKDKTIIDPNFWSLPIMAIARDIDNAICSRDISKHFTLVPEINKSTKSISESLLKNCLERGFNRYDFTETLFLNIVAVRDIYRHCVLDTRNNFNVDYYKHKLVKEYAFKLFPLHPSLHNKCWDKIADSLRFISTEIKTRAKETFDVSAILDYL